MADTKYITIRIPVPEEAYEKIQHCDVLVTFASHEEIEFARQACGEIQRELESGDPVKSRFAEALTYIVAFFNRSIHIKRTEKERMQ